MAKIGDTVRFLSTTGGGVITRIEGNIAYVDEDGFETPVLLKEVVVVMPAGHQPEVKGAKKMFDQAAYDEGRKKGVEETPHGDTMNLVLAFEPSDVKSLDKSRFAAVLVNDSNYTLHFIFMRRADGDRGWTDVFNGTVAPNELIDLAALTHADLPGYERIAFQCIAFKSGKPFAMQPPVSVSRRLDLTKFHKFHCFRPGLYFDNPVLEIPLVSNGVASKPLEVNAAEVADAMKQTKEQKEVAAQLAKKYNVDSNRKKKAADPSQNPRKVLPLIEVDLHIGELTDSIAGMEPKDMLQRQLDAVRRHMHDNANRIGQKLVFIHGKGDGVLRKAVLALLKKEFPKAETQDASFQEYGFGATLVKL